MIRVKNLTKEYSSRRGIFDLSFEIQDGEVFGLLGPRGSGKTTLFEILAGFARQTQGTCMLNGKIPGKNQSAIVRFTGCLAERTALPEERTAMDYLRYIAGLRGVRNLERALQVMRHFGIETDQRIGKMRKGQRQMLALACAMVHDPKILLLDEPDRHLDALLQARLDALLLEEKARGTTILVTSENYLDMERVCDRIGLLRRGELVTLDDAASMRMSRKKTYLVIFQTEMEALRFLRENPGMKQIGANQVLMQVHGEILSCLQLLGKYQVAGFELMPQSLEEIFGHFYGGGAHA
ncbi:MAG: ABC transporter ATP-binding protein [Eubacteriales bacterium]|nr:ABC transporter ATP-binding protein [Eubacteriales bacterium]